MERLVRKMYDEAPPRPGSDGKFLAFRDEDTGWNPYPRWERVAEEAVQAEEANAFPEEETSPTKQVQYGLKEGRLTDFVKLVSAMYDLGLFHALDGRKNVERGVDKGVGRVLWRGGQESVAAAGCGQEHGQLLACIRRFAREG